MTLHIFCREDDLIFYPVAPDFPVERYPGGYLVEVEDEAAYIDLTLTLPGKRQLLSRRTPEMARRMARTTLRQVAAAQRLGLEDTGIPGQETVYMVKQAEVARYEADPGSISANSDSWIKREADALGIPIAQAVARVKTAADAWNIAAGDIEARRQKGIALIETAKTLEEIDAVVGQVFPPKKAEPVKPVIPDEKLDEKP